MSETKQASIENIIAIMGEMQGRMSQLVQAIHGTHSSIARVQAAIRKDPRHVDTMTPMDAFYGVPFVCHDTEDKARESAWKQAVTKRCKVMLVEHDKYFEIDGLAMARMLDQLNTMPYVFGSGEPTRYRPRFF